jgi:hypothetical protein
LMNPPRLVRGSWARTGEAKATRAVATRGRAEQRIVRLGWKGLLDLGVELTLIEEEMSRY